MNSLAFAPLLLAVLLGLRSLRITRQGNSVLVERLGTFSRTLAPGINVVVPFLEKEVSSQSLKERVLDVPPQPCITKDNVAISVDAVIYWQLVDHFKSYYAVLNMETALVNLVLTQIRSEVGLMDLDQTFSARQAINDRLLQELDAATDPWGIKVTRVELRELLPSPGVTAAMEKQMTAERRKRATILDSEGEQEAAINVARGRAEALVLEKEAESRAVVINAEAQSKAVVIDAEATAQQQKLLAEARGQAAATLAEVLERHPTAAEALRLLLAKDWMTMGEQLAHAKAGSVLMVDPQSPGSLLAALKDLQQKS
ncbi:MAG: paraslipin [Synechococcus sp. SB0666_bin_14]|nr:paraslipin [Synechococcus sp. SB0666_bin_14]MYA90744.1 paraslipin [Synechococcus sp. SB0663_bin_10]MYG46042.1 paraslipin [Synechococcus sp. SB0675_bin_6]MYK91953.1 paraslipin [Synechococcus sp. SB0669_bin_8]